MKKYWVLIYSLFCLGIVTANAQYTEIYDFTNANLDYGNEAVPVGSLIPSITGDTLFGVTSLGGKFHLGSIFYIIVNSNVYDTLYSFSGSGEDGSNPNSSLTLSHSGKVLYGISYYGGSDDQGLLFSFTINTGVFTNLHSFTGTTYGTYPTGSLTLSSSGDTLYGITYTGGRYNSGTIFLMDTNGTGFDTLHSLPIGNYDDGPSSSLLLFGNILYGMTYTGGQDSNGTIFSIHTNGTGFDTLHNFGKGIDGKHPGGALIYSSGLLYGMTANGGGVHNSGTIFSINPSGNGYKTLFSFDGTNGEFPSGSLTISGNKLYGMTDGHDLFYGNIFSINTNGTGFDTLFNFDFTDGANPICSLTLLGNKLYGVTGSGGITTYGVIFSYQVDLCTTFVTVNIVANVSCYGGSNGSALAIPSGGTGAYTYSWSNGNSQTTAIATGLSAGTYTVTVTDSEACYATASVIITQPNILDISATAIANVSCNGENNGIISSSVNGGTSPYSYLWSPNGQTTTSISGLSAGSYIVTVTDSCGSSATASVTITEPLAMTVAQDSIPDDSNCNGLAAVTPSGGISPYTYLWTSGGQTTDTIKNQCAGTYCCTITDNNDCSQTSCIVIPSSKKKHSSNYSSVNPYPNPNNGTFIISTPGELISSYPLSVEIYNQIGQKILKETLSTTGGDNIISVTTQPNGIYLYRVLQEDGSLIGEGKVIIQK